MVPVIIKTDGRLAAADRFVQYKQQVLARQAVPVKLHIDRPEGFAAKLTVRAAGVVDLATLSTHSCVPSLAERTPKLIRQSDPEAYRLVVNVSGESQAAHGEHDVELGPGDMALYDTSLPFRVWRGAVNGGSGTNTWAMATFSHTLLPLRPRAVRRLLGGRLCGRAGLGALLSELTQLTTQDTHLGRSHTAVQLSTAIVDLLAALILRELDETAAVSPESAGRALLLRSQNFIETRLGEPEMDPEMVAAAHHVSTRSLHRAFNDHGLTVSGWIRTRRLDRCRRDLADPTLATEPVHVIAARWGLRNQAHFSRVFRAVYGTSPLDYRRQAQLSGPAETSNETA